MNRKCIVGILAATMIGIVPATASASTSTSLCVSNSQLVSVTTPLTLGGCLPEFTLTEFGEEGPAGPEGKEGTKGTTGATGATGPEGPEGKEGPRGLEGAKGETGPEGKEGKEGKGTLTWRSMESISTKIKMLGAPYEEVLCAIDGYGIVHCQGGFEVKEAGTEGAVLFVLPTALRPSRDQWIDMMRQGTSEVKPIKITTSGKVESELALGTESKKFIFSVNFPTTA